MFHFFMFSAFFRISFRILQTVTQWLSSSTSGFLRTRQLDHASSQKTILSLPPETLFEILFYLNFRDLVSAKLTCRAFYSATRSRQFWHRLLQSLESTPDGPNFYEKLHRRATRELEHRAMERLRVYDCWVLDEPLVFQPRSFQYSETTSIEEARLLPGGRYLLANNLKGQFFVCDLQLPYPQLEILFDPGEYDAKDKTLDNLMSFEVWVDTSAETLSFRVAVWRYMGPEKRGYVTRARIYQVDLSKDGEELRWTATRIFGQRSHHYARRPCVGLSDRFLVEARATGTRHTDNLRQQLVLRQYMPVAASQPKWPEISVQIGIEDDVSGVFVSTHGHVVATSPTSIDVYIISQLEHQDPQHEASPVYRFPQGSYRRDIVPPFFYQDFTWMVILHRNEYHLLRLPKDTANDLPLLTPLGHRLLNPDNRHLSGSVGQSAAAVLQRDWTLNVVTYSWNAKTTESAFRIKKSRLPKLSGDTYRYAMVGADILSGRVVLLHSGERTCIILDMA